jgi:hypothetical protein
MDSAYRLAVEHAEPVDRALFPATLAPLTGGRLGDGVSDSIAAPSLSNRLPGSCEPGRNFNLAEPHRRRAKTSLKTAVQLAATASMHAPPARWTLDLSPAGAVAGVPTNDVTGRRR